MTEFRMPSLGADMDDGTLVQWLKQPGDRLKRGDIVAVVETQKGAIEIEIFQDGVLEQVVAMPGMKLPVGAILAIIRVDGEEAGAAPASPAALPTVPLQITEPRGTPVTAVAQIPLSGRLKVTPAARREASERNIALAAIKPGSDGIIGLREVEALTGPQQKARGIDFEEMRKAIGAAMARSKREIPHYYVSSAIDVSQMLEWLARVNAERSADKRLLPIVPIIKATALALLKVRELNGHYIEDRFEPARHVKMGIGIAVRGGGLIAPAIEDVEALAVDGIMSKLADLSVRARGGRLRSSELMQTTITFSGLGEESADMLFPIIYPPQVAIVGMGQIAERPRAIKNDIRLRKVAEFTIAGDHRVSDGRSAARFLKLLQSLLDKPETL
jgi:pyruvate dehydrogenase E2 component (dihydrolipoamide acetyltransferase)